MSTRIDSDIGALLRLVAVGRDGSEDDTGRWTDEVFAAALLAAPSETLVGAFAEGVTAGWLPVTERQRFAVRSDHRRAMQHAVDLEREVARASAALTEAGVEHRLLKGLAVGRMAYRDPGNRECNDGDLLVAPGSLETAIAVLRELGGQRELPEVRPGFDARFAKDVPIRLGPVEIDLHRTLLGGSLGARLPIEELFVDVAHVRLAGVEVPTMLAPHHLLHAAVTAALADQPPRLGTLRDLLALARLAPDTLTASADLAARWQIDSVLARAIMLTNNELRPRQALILPRRIADASGQLGRLERWAYLGPSGSYRRAASLLLSPPGLMRASYLRAIMVPSVSYRSARGWSRRSHWARSIRRLRRG